MKEADSKLLKLGEEIWHIDGRVACFTVRESEPGASSEQRFTGVADLFVPYPSQSGCLSVYIHYQSERDLPTVRRVLQSIEWKKAPKKAP